MGVPAGWSAEAVRAEPCRRRCFADDISARVTLFDTAADTTDNGIAEMFHVPAPPPTICRWRTHRHHRTAVWQSWHRGSVTSEGRSYRRHRSPRSRVVVTAAPRDYTGPPNKTHRAGLSVGTAAESVIRDRLQREADLADYGSPQVLPRRRRFASPYTRRL